MPLYGLDVKSAAVWEARLQTVGLRFRVRDPFQSDGPLAGESKVRTSFL